MMPTTITREKFFQIAEDIYGWDLIDKEREILEGMARLHTGSVVLDNWELFQKRCPGHPAWEFAEWFEEFGNGDEEQ